jgi:hypothetical protein
MILPVDYAARLPRHAPKSRAGKTVEQAAKQRGGGDVDKMLAMFDLIGKRDSKLTEIAKLEMKLAQVVAMPLPEEQINELARLIAQMHELPEGDRYALRARINSQVKAFAARVELDRDGEITIVFGSDGKPYPPDPTGQFLTNYKLRFVPVQGYDGKRSDKDMPHPPAGFHREHVAFAPVRLGQARIRAKKR